MNPGDGSAWPWACPVAGGAEPLPLTGAGGATEWGGREVGGRWGFVGWGLACPLDAAGGVGGRGRCCPFDAAGGSAGWASGGVSGRATVAGAALVGRGEPAGTGAWRTGE